MYICSSKTKETANMNAIIYARVSTDLQDFNRQIEDIKAYCNKENIEIISEFTEKESGTKRARIELTSMIAFCKNSKPDYVIISELSRLGRTSEVSRIIETLNDLKICLISLKENLKTLNEDKTINSTAGLIISVMSGINTFELSTMKYRIASGILSAAKNGKAMCGIYYPYGFTVDKNGKLIINETEAETVRLMFQMYMDGNGIFKICKYLNTKNIPSRTGKLWSETPLHKIFTNTIYIGKRKYKNTIIELPSIIDDELFEGVNIRLKSKINMISINKKHTYLLDNRLIKCGGCGYAYIGIKSSKNSAYKCSSRTLRSCENPSISLKKLEESVTKVILTHFPQLLLRNQDNTNINSEVEKNKINIQLFEKNLKDEEKAESNLLNIALQGFDENMIRTKLAEIRKNQNFYNAEINQLKNQNKTLLNQLDQQNNLQLVAMDILEKGINKELLRKIVSKIIIHKSDVKLSPNKQDITARIELFIGTTTISFLISQRSDVLKIVEDFNNQRFLELQDSGSNPLKGIATFLSVLPDPKDQYLDSLTSDDSK